MTRHPDTARLSSDFGDRWGYQAPTSGRLRTVFFDEWVRFHSFANLRRYPSDEGGIRQAHRRHRRVLQDVRRGHGRGRLIFVATGVEPWEALADDGSTYMAFHRPNDVPGLTDWFHARNPWDVGPYAPTAIVYGTAKGTVRDLDRVLHQTIIGMQPGLTITDESMNWLYCPYDGGADIVLPTSADRDRLAARHERWLSP